MKKLLTLILLALVSCSEPSLDELTLDYSSQEAKEACLIDLETKLTDDQYNELMKVIVNTRTAESRKAIKENQEGWQELADERTRKELHGKSVAELLNR